MLRSLTIRDFTLISEVDLSFEPGLTVMLGETGAGKSIIIDALSAALGERTSSDSVRSGAKKCIIEATFDRPASAEFTALLRDNELEWDAPEVLFRREITATGTSRCFVNDSPVQASVARALADLILDVHGQHDTHGLLHQPTHVHVLDLACGTVELTEIYRGLWDAYRVSERVVTELRERAAHADAERDRHERLIKEIGTIAPSRGEDEQVLQDLNRLERIDDIRRHAAGAHEALYGASPSATELVRTAIDHLRALIDIDADAAQYASELDAAAVSIAEAAKHASRLIDEEDTSAERLEELRERLAHLQRLRRTHGSLDAAIDAWEEALQLRDEIGSLDDALAAAIAAADAARDAAQKAASKLSAARRKGARAVDTAVTELLASMGMPAARLVTQVEPGTSMTSTGTDTVAFLFSANPGEEPKPLAKIASGGELSRVMLAIKHCIAARGDAGTMVFDEIDTGISGRIARAVGEVMHELASRHQLICITHLPQIASLADAFIAVRKDTVGDAAVVHATALTRDEAVSEIAALLSAESVTTTAVEGARELMKGRRHA
jgi:DNA repair protein RecN (Recombination protein N)